MMSFSLLNWFTIKIKIGNGANRRVVTTAFASALMARFALCFGDVWLASPGSLSLLVNDAVLSNVRSCDCWLHPDRLTV